MSIVAVVAQIEDPNTMTLAALRPVTGFALSDLKRRLKLGTPLIEQEMWLNDHEELAAKIDALIDAADDVGLPLRFFELQPDERLSNADLGQVEISEEQLRRIL